MDSEGRCDLVVTVLEAIDLLPKGQGRKLPVEDAVIKLKLNNIWRSTSVVCTSALGTTGGKVQEEFSFSSLSSSGVLEVFAASAHSTPPASFIGAVAIPVARLPENERVEQWYLLKPPPNGRELNSAVRLELHLATSGVADHFLDPGAIPHLPPGAKMPPQPMAVSDAPPSPMSTSSQRLLSVGSAHRVNQPLPRVAEHRRRGGGGGHGASMGDKEGGDAVSHAAGLQSSSKEGKEAEGIVQGDAGESGQGHGEAHIQDAGHTDGRVTKAEPVPEEDEELEGEGGAAEETGTSVILPCGLVDYMLVVTCDPAAPSSGSPAQVVARFPAVDIPEFPFPELCEWFCFPEGCPAERHGPRPKSALSTFAFQAGPEATTWGVCLHSHAPAPSTPGAWVPWSLCFLTRFPVMNALQAFLAELDSFLCRDVPTAHVEWTLASELLALRACPLPVTDRMMVTFHAFERQEIQCSVCAPYGMPASTFGLPEPLKCLGSDVGVELLSYALGERKLLFHSADSAALAPVTEAVCTLMYPLQWIHTYVPVLPRSMLEVLESPQPFIIGIHSDWLPEVRPEVLEDILVFDVDRGVLVVGEQSDASSALPADCKAVLKRVLDNFLMEGAGVSDDLTVLGRQRQAPLGCTEAELRLSFAREICSLLRGFNDCVFWVHAQWPVFDQERFLGEVRRPAEGAALRQLIDTQMFHQLLQDYEGEHLALFREVIGSGHLRGGILALAGADPRTNGIRVALDRALGEARWGQHRPEPDVDGQDEPSAGHVNDPEVMANVLRLMCRVLETSGHDAQADGWELSDLARTAGVDERHFREALDLEEPATSAGGDVVDGEGQDEAMAATARKGLPSSPSRWKSMLQLRPVDETQRSTEAILVERDDELSDEESRLLRCVAMSLSSPNGAPPELVETVEQEFAVHKHLTSRLLRILDRLRQHTSSPRAGNRKGRGGHRLPAVAFEALARLCHACLLACATADDLMTPYSVLQLTGRYYQRSSQVVEYLSTRVCEHKVFADSRLWESVLRSRLASPTIAQALPTPRVVVQEVTSLLYQMRALGITAHRAVIVVAFIVGQLNLAGRHWQALHAVVRGIWRDANLPSLHKLQLAAALEQPRGEGGLEGGAGAEGGLTLGPPGTGSPRTLSELSAQGLAFLGSRSQSSEPDVVLKAPSPISPSPGVTVPMMELACSWQPIALPPTPGAVLSLAAQPTASAALGAQATRAALSWSDGSVVLLCGDDSGRTVPYTTRPLFRQQDALITALSVCRAGVVHGDSAGLVRIALQESSSAEMRDSPRKRRSLVSRVLGYRPKSQAITAHPAGVSALTLFRVPQLTGASGGLEGSIRIWRASDMSSEPCFVTSILPHTDAVQSLAAHEESLLAAGRASGEVDVWDVDTAARVFAVEAHSRKASIVHFTGVHTLCSGSADRTVGIWDTRVRSRDPRSAQLRLCEHAAPVSVIQQLSGQWANLLVTGSGDGTARVWDLRATTRGSIFTFSHHSHATVVSITPSSGSQVVSTGSDGQVFEWSVVEPFHSSTITPVSPALAVQAVGKELLAFTAAGVFHGARGSSASDQPQNASSTSNTPEDGASVGGTNV